MLEFPGYQLDRELGRGAMAVVYLATQLSLKRQVALKVLDRNVDNYPELAKRFINEAHTLASMQHRNIVQVYDVVASQQGDFISMEYLVGGSLTDRLEVGLGVQQSLAILAQLGSALEIAHNNGVVHRDIKPDNVLFRDADTPVLADFGIARVLKSDSLITKDGLVVGTPRYMSPEQIAGDPVDGRADQYSLGAMWFEMLTGHPPYDAESTTDLLYAHISRPVPLLPQELSTLQPVLNRMLAKKPDERYPDMASMLLDVSRNLLKATQLLHSPPGEPQVSATERLHQLGFRTTGLHSRKAIDSAQVTQPVHSPAIGKLPLLPKRKKWIAIGASALAILAATWIGLSLREKMRLPVASPSREEARVVAESKGDVPLNGGIAVLPFVNMSSDKDQDFLADGMAEEMINRLAKIPQLRVIARTSSFSYKGKEIKIDQIANELDVQYILEGSLRKSGEKYRVNAQLIRAADSSRLWSQSFDLSLDDVFVVQDEIAGAVIEQIKPTLLGAKLETQSIDPKAYALYLRARQVARRSTADAFEEAIALYLQVLAIEPGYAPAWVGLANCYTNQVDFLAVLPKEEGRRLARAAVAQALAQDPEYGSAHAELGWIAWSDGDLSSAAQHYSRAVALAPTDSKGLLGATNIAQDLGRVEAAISLGEFVVARDPLNPDGYYSLGASYQRARRWDESIASYQKALDLLPDAANAHFSIGMSLLQKGKPKEALAEMGLEPSGCSCVPAGLAMAWHALGDDAKSDAFLKGLIATEGSESAYNIAYVFAFRGEANRAFEWLDKAVLLEDSGLTALASEPLFDGLHEDPRWLPLLRRVGQAPDQLSAIKFEAAVPNLRINPRKNR
jgi:serine/threonine protein kinase/TolB-like protein/Flp pilus assembly protein TadD